MKLSEFITKINGYTGITENSSINFRQAKDWAREELKEIEESIQKDFKVNPNNIKEKFNNSNYPYELDRRLGIINWIREKMK